MSDLAETFRDVADVLELATTDPTKAADILDGWADDLKAAAQQLRDGAPIESRGAFGDKVFAKVYGPDGQLKGEGGSA